LLVRCEAGGGGGSWATTADVRVDAGAAVRLLAVGVANVTLCPDGGTDVPEPPLAPDPDPGIDPALVAGATACRLLAGAGVGAWVG
jgi:hypothetical protein